MAGLFTSGSQVRRGSSLIRSKIEVAYYLVALVSSIIILALQGYIFAIFIRHLEKDSGNKARTIATFLALFTFAQIYQLYLSYNSIRNENTVQLYMMILFYAAMVFYAGIQYMEIKRMVLGSLSEKYKIAAQACLISIIGVLGVTLILQSLLTFKLREGFGYNTSHLIGCDPKTKSRYNNYKLYVSLLRFDFFFFLGFTIQFCVIILKKNDLEFYLTIAVIPVTIIILFLSYLFARKEIKIGMYFIFFIYLCAMAYFIFKMVRMYGSKKDVLKAYITARKSLTAFASVTILMLLSTMITWCLVLKEFGNGLKELIDTEPLWCCGARKKLIKDDSAYADIDAYFNVNSLEQLSYDHDQESTENSLSNINANQMSNFDTINANTNLTYSTNNDLYNDHLHDSRDSHDNKGYKPLEPKFIID